MNEPVLPPAAFDPTRLLPPFGAAGSQAYRAAQFVRGARESHV